MPGIEEIPAGMDGAALKDVGEDHGRAVSRNEDHQSITCVSKWPVDPEQPGIEEQHGGFGTGYGYKIDYCCSFGPLDLILFTLPIPKKGTKLTVYT